MVSHQIRLVVSILLAFTISHLFTKLVFVSNTPRIKQFFQPSPTITESVNPQSRVTTIPSPTQFQSNIQKITPNPSSYQSPTYTPTPIKYPSPTKQPTSTPYQTGSIITSTPTLTPTPYIQQVQSITCPYSSNQSYSSLSTLSQSRDNPATHPDLNLTVRGFISANGTRDIIDMAGPTDSKAPQLTNLFSTPRRPEIRNIYKVYDWDWSNNTKGGLISYSEIQLIGLTFTPGEVIRVPSSGYSIGNGLEVLILYADPNRITFTYTREGSAAFGYVIHLEDICVDPNLLTLYNNLHSQGRTQLPALEEKKVIGVARSNEVKVAIRDTGQFMDPRIRKDWWVGY